MARPRPTEVKLVRSLITDQEWEDENELAAAIIAALDEMRGRDRSYYALLVKWGETIGAYGPFLTFKQAEKAYLAGMGRTGHAGEKAGIAPMTTPEQGWAAIEAAG